jgi:hypothetical protein
VRSAAIAFAILAAASVTAFASALEQTNTFEMPTLGARLPITAFKLINQVPRSRVSKLPKAMPVFRKSASPQDFSTNGLQTLLDQSAFAGTNVASLLRGHSNVGSMDGPIRLFTTNHMDYFFVDAGSISYATHDLGVNPRLESPDYDSIPNFDAMLGMVLHYASVFGANTNELERKEDGSLFMRRTDDKTVMRGGAVKFISRRSLTVSRSLAGYPLLSGNYKVELALGAKGHLLKFEMIWPNLETVRTNRLLSIDQMLTNIKQGRVLADLTTQYPSDGVSEVILKDFRVFYYVPEARDPRQDSTNPNIVPVISFHAVFKSKSGKTEDGGLFTPLTE